MWTTGVDQIDVAHALTSDLGLNDLNATLLAGDTAVLHPLVLSAETLVVLHRAEDLGAEEAVLFRLEGPVVDGLRLLDFAEATRNESSRARPDRFALRRSSAGSWASKSVVQMSFTVDSWEGDLLGLEKWVDELKIRKG